MDSLRSSVEILFRKYGKVVNGEVTVNKSQFLSLISNLDIMDDEFLAVDVELIFLKFCINGIMKLENFFENCFLELAKKKFSDADEIISKRLLRERINAKAQDTAELGFSIEQIDEIYNCKKPIPEKEPEDLLYQVFKSYANGKEQIVLEEFTRFCKKTNLFSPQFYITLIFILFEKSVNKGEKYIYFDGFKRALHLLAEYRYPELSSQQNYNYLISKILSKKHTKLF